MNEPVRFDSPNLSVILSYDSRMRFQLNFKAGKAVYQQLVDQVKVAAAAGAVQPGDPLPGIRPLAEELRVNRNTVAKAYAALESQGIIETVAGKGVFRSRSGPLTLQERRPLKLLAESLDDVVVHAHICRSAVKNSCNLPRIVSTRSSSVGLALQRHEL